MEQGSGGVKAAVDFTLEYGHEILIASIVVLGGLIVIKVVMAYIKKILPRYTKTSP